MFKPHSVPLWIVTLIICMMMVFSVIAGIKIIEGYRGIHGSVGSDAVDMPVNALLYVAGNTLQSDWSKGFSFVYGEESDSRLISDAVADAVFQSFVGELVTLPDVLRTLGNIPYTFFIMEDDTGKLVWAGAVSISQKQIHHLLHDSFSSHVSLATVRERTVPSGTVVRDVVPRGDELIHHEEKRGSFHIRKTENGNGALLTASNSRSLLVSNSDAALKELMNLSIGSKRPVLLATASGTQLFAAKLPESDVSRFLITQNEGLLSLSSWRCIP